MPQKIHSSTENPLINSRNSALPSDTIHVVVCGGLCIGLLWSTVMNKRETIDYILEINKGAKPEFLAQFPVEELDLYLEHLMELDLEDIALCA